MSYVCHGCQEILDSEWCNNCKILIKCDCDNITSTRVKDIKFECDDGERTVTIWIYHCKTCGDVIDIGFPLTIE
jgi:hypothetical protein